MTRARPESGFTLIETLFVVGLIGVISAIAVPMFSNAIANFRISGDARSLSNAVAVAKMRAAANFSRVRIFVDRDEEEFHLQSWDKTTSKWITEGGSTFLSTGVDFDYDTVATAPPHTQGTIGQAEACKDDDGNVIGNTSCVIFNSRGTPVDSSYSPTGNDALYITDYTVVYAVTVASTGMIRSWKTPPQATPAWTLH
jgi:prepilin-type N-terminal cleavage/methylation domain-containing protein